MCDAREGARSLCAGLLVQLETGPRKQATQPKHSTATLTALAYSSLHMFARASQLFLETLWPARGKWKGGADGVASESKGFRIRVAVRVRPRKHDGSLNGLVLPLHQRLKMLKKGEKLGTFEDEMNGSSQEQLAAALKDQGELSPELLQVRTEPSPSQAKHAFTPPQPSPAKPSTHAASTRPTLSR